MKFSSSCFLRIFLFALLFFTCFGFSFSAFNLKCEEPELLSLFKKAYPDIQFKSEYNAFAGDWKISLSLGERTAEFFWADGMFLPESEIENKSLYNSFLYNTTLFCVIRRILQTRTLKEFGGSVLQKIEQAARERLRFFTILCMTARQEFHLSST